MPTEGGENRSGGLRAAALRLKTAADAVVTAGEFALGLAFMALVATVGYQVAARNLLGIPAIWTPHVAQLLFSWLIFVGSGFAYRRNTHYVVDLFPSGWVTWDRVLRALAPVAALIVGYVLIRYGLVMVELRGRANVPTLGISWAWMYWPLPILGAMVMLFTLERGLYRVAGVS